MAIPTLVRVNQRLFSRASCAFRVGGTFRLTEVDSISWNDEVPTELVGGANDGGVPLGKVRGPYTCSATISVYVDAASKFEAMVRSTSLPPVLGTNIADANFQLVITMKEDVRLRVVTLMNCSIKAQSQSVGSDGAALVEEYQLQPTLIMRGPSALVNLLPAL